MYDIEQIKARFLSKVDKTDYCWNWTAGSRGHGYGAFKFKDKLIDSHRVAYLLFKGDIPEGLFVCHSCDNRKCVNPDHLWLGTPKDNMQDCKNKGRLVIPEGTKFKVGNKPVMSKLTDNEVVEIKYILKINRGDLTLNDIAALYKVKPTVIRDISCGRTYKNTN